MNYKIDRKVIDDEQIWRLEITDHNYHDYPAEYTIIIECKTEEGLLKNITHYTKKYLHELGIKSRVKKNRK